MGVGTDNGYQAGEKHKLTTLRKHVGDVGVGEATNRHVRTGSAYNTQEDGVDGLQR